MRLLLLLLPAIALSQSIPATSDEWVGPFSSWTNVKTACSAAGDGSTDDSAAIQSCLDAIQEDNSVSPTLYFPAGNYKIVTGLVIAHRINIQFIGHSQSDTTITWAGANGGTMLYLNGVAYSKFSRFTINGNTNSGYCIDQSWDSNSGGYFDTDNEYSDIIFTNCQIAYRCGFLGQGCAETSILRDQFLHASVAGVALYNFNALDIWIWYSTFDTCYVGVTNALGGGAGNYHVYNSNFFNSTTADLVLDNGGGFSARNNYSIGSNRFWDSVFTGNPAVITMQGNTILDTADDLAVNFKAEGPELLLDNVFRSRVGFTGGPVVHSDGFPNATSTLMGNTYGNSNTTEQNEQVQWTIIVDDATVARNTINPSQPTLPGELPNLGRTITNVATKTGTAIQTAVNTACASNGTRPVVHLPYGNYFVSSTISIPVCDVQIIGDGMGDVQGTFLIWNGAGSGPVISMAGPSRATLRDFEVNGNGTADGIVLNNADQVGARVFTDQMLLGGSINTLTNLNVNGLDNTFLEFENYQQETGVSKCTGGPNKQAGSTNGRLDIFSAATGISTPLQYDISLGCTFLLRDQWYESNFMPGFMSIHGKATVTMEGGEVSTGGTPEPFVITDLSGIAVIAQITMDQGFTITGDGTNAKVMVLGCVSNVANSTSYFLDTTSPAGNDQMFNCRNAVVPNVGAATTNTDNVGSATTPFFETMLAQDRAEAPAVLSSLSTSLTDARFFRVRAYNGVNNFTINADPPPPPNPSSQSHSIQYRGSILVN